MTRLQFHSFLCFSACCFFAFQICAEDLGYEKSFSLSLTYEKKEGGAFSVALKNTSKIDLTVALNSVEVEGDFSILSGNDKGKSFCDKEYFRKRRTAIWWFPARELKAGDEIRWTVKLSDLVYPGLDEEPVTHANLSGKSVSLTLNRLSVYPAQGKSNVDVKVRSNIIQIPSIEQDEPLKPRDHAEPK